MHHPNLPCSSEKASSPRASTPGPKYGNGLRAELWRLAFPESSRNKRPLQGLQLHPVSHPTVGQHPIPRETNHHRAYSTHPTNNCIINQRSGNADKRCFEDLVIEDWLQRCVAWLTWVTWVVPRMRPWALGERPDSIDAQLCLQRLEWDAAFFRTRL